MGEAIGSYLDKEVALSFHDVAGSTDLAIVRQALRRYGNSAQINSGSIEAVLSAYLELLEKRLPGSDDVKVYPGARELVSACREAGWATAIMTGNVERGARAKLAGTGLLEMFDFGIYGDDGHQREDLPFVAAERGWDVLAESFPPGVTTLIGDTPNDARVARMAGMANMIVCRREEPEWRAAIEAESPTWLVDSLADTDQLMAYLKGA